VSIRGTIKKEMTAGKGIESCLKKIYTAYTHLIMPPAVNSMGDRRGISIDQFPISLLIKQLAILMPNWLHLLSRLAEFPPILPTFPPIFKKGA
jgi:hypothetical protein